MAARRERGLLDPDAAPGESVFDRHVYVIASDGDMEEGISAEASSLAGHQQLGNLTLIWDDNRISIEGDTDVAFTEDVAARYAAYGWHVQHVDVAAGRRRRRRRARRRAARRARAETTSRRSSRCAPSSPGPRRTRRTRAPLTAPRSAPTRSRPPSASSASTRTRRFDVDPDVLAHAREVGAARARCARRVGHESSPTWRDGAPRAGRPVRPPRRATSCPTAGSPPSRSSRPTPRASPPARASGKVHRRPRRRPARAVGRLGRPRRLEQHHDPGRALVRSPAGRERARTPTRPAACCTSASASTRMGAIMNGIALHGRSHVFGGTFLVFSDYMRPVGPARRADGPAGHLRVDPRLDRRRRGRSRRTSRSSTSLSLRADPRPRRRPPGRRQRDRRGLEGRGHQHAARRRSR